MQNQICIPQINSDKDALSSYIDWTYCLQNMQIINMLQKCSAGELVLSGMERKIWMQEKIKVDETRLVKASSVLKEFAMDVFFWQQYTYGDKIYISAFLWLIIKVNRYVFHVFS